LRQPLGETSEELVPAAYGPNYARLVELKKEYHPKNVLRLNQSIKPDQPSTPGEAQACVAEQVK
jgi:hypothetical protein